MSSKLSSCAQYLSCLLIALRLVQPNPSSNMSCIDWLTFPEDWVFLTRSLLLKHLTPYLLPWQCLKSFLNGC